MKKYISALLVILSPVWGQTRVDYPSQIKNGPVIIDITYATLDLGCQAAAAANAVLNVTKQWNNVPTTHCNAVVNFIGSSARIEPANFAIFFSNGYTAPSRQQVWLVDTTGVVRITGSGTGSPIFAQNFSTLTSACDTSVVATSTLTVSAPVNTAQIPTSFSCAANIYADAGGIMTPASGQTLTLTGSFDGAITQHFDLSAGGSVDLSGAIVGPMPVQWWGVVGDGSTSNSSTLPAAFAAAAARHGELYAPCGTYLFGAELTISAPMTFRGDGAADAPCTILKKTADVIGIHVQSGANFTKLLNFSMTSTAGSGASDGIAVGDADNTNGAGEVRIQDVTVSSQKGNGINIRNGNSGVIDHAFMNANGGHGLTISSQQTSVDNTNLWRIYSASAINNTGDGFHFDNAAVTLAHGLDSETNTGRGIYCNRPYMDIEGYAEANTAGNLVTTASCFETTTNVRDVNNTTTQGSPGSWMYNKNGVGNNPTLNPNTGQVGVKSLVSPVVTPTYTGNPFGSNVIINNDLGNSFVVTVTDGNPFTVLSPSNPSVSQKFTVTILNSSGGALGAVTWNAYIMSPWLSPANGCYGSITFQHDVNTGLTEETTRSYADVCGSSPKAYFMYSHVAPVVIPTLFGTSASTALSYPNIPVDAVWKTTCNALTTTVGTGSGTVLLTLLYNGAAYGENSPLTLDLTSTTTKKISVSDWETVPANTSGGAVGMRWTVGGTNTGGVFTVSCVSERVQ